MAQTKQKRDNEYFLERLRVEHPAAHADFLAGEFKNLNEALVKVGLRKPRSSLDALKSAWKKASMSERDTFKAFIGCITPTVASAPVARPSFAKSPSHTTTATTGMSHLPPALKAAVSEIMKRRHLKLGQVMCEMGRDPLNTSLGRALFRDTQLQNSLIKDLEAWVVKYKLP